MIDAFRRSSAARITAVIPYYGYARQDRKDKPRVPISAKLVANLLSAAGTNRVLTMDLHKAQIQGFFDIPVDHLFAAPVIIDYLSRLDYPKLTIVSPDAGGAERARAYAKRLDAELAVIDKRRSDDGTAEVMNVIGDVEGRTCILQDDIIDTAGTITKGAAALKANGAARVIACAVHGVLSGPAIDRIEKSPIDKLIVTNTIPLSRRARRAARSSCCRWRGCSDRRSRAFTRRRRSRRCSCRGSAESEPIRDVGIRTMEAALEAQARDTRQERSAAHAPRRPGARRALRRRRQGRRRRSRWRPKALLKILHSESGANTLITLKLAGAGDTRVLVKDYQLDPITHQLLHADFYRVAMDKLLRVTVPIVVKGEPKGVKQQGGILDFVRREIEVEVPAGRHSGAHRRRRHRADAAPGRPRARPRDRREVEAGQRPRHDARPRHHAEGRGSRGAGRRRGRRPARRPSPKSSRRARRTRTRARRRTTRRRTTRRSSDEEVAGSREADRRARQSGPAVPGHAPQRRLRRWSTSWRGARRSASSRRRPTR